MKNRLLFVCESLALGGTERSLVTLLRFIDTNLFDIDLLLLDHNDELRKELPDNINIYYVNDIYHYWKYPLFQALRYLIAKKKYSLAIIRLLISIMDKINIRIISMHKFIVNTVITAHYDVAIAYMHGQSTNLIAYLNNAKFKIAWYHIGIFCLTHRYKCHDLIMYKQFDKIITVSESCRVMFINEFPDLSNKVIVYMNIIDKSEIHKLSIQPVIREFPKGSIKIISVGRLSKEKRYDLSIEACKLLVDSRYNICWYIIGEGNEYPLLRTQIDEYELGNNLFLLGKLLNPYPLIREADIFVSTSCFEGDPIAIREAQILNKCIVVSDIPGTSHLITDGKNGFRTKLSAASISSAIQRYIENTQEAHNIRINISNSKESHNTESITETINRIFNI